MGKNSEEVIKRRIEECPRLASLGAISKALKSLVNAETTYTGDIAEIVRRDPSLTTRLLRMVNSVFFGLSREVTNIEDAIIYLGLRQVREMVLATPIIEDFSELNKVLGMEGWKRYWQHSIGVAMMAREVIQMTGVSFQDETDYLVGLLHNVGKLVLAFAFTEDYRRVLGGRYGSIEELLREEEGVIGWDHQRAGGYYLNEHKLPGHVSAVARNHHYPERGESVMERKLCAAVYLADLMVQSIGISGIEGFGEVDEGVWVNSDKWEIIFDRGGGMERSYGVAGLKYTLKKLPGVIQGMMSE